MEKKKICLITVVNNISATSMSVNEFVFYKNKNYPEYRQVMIACVKDPSITIDVPEGIELHALNGTGKGMRKILKDAVSRAKKDGYDVVFHLHFPTSGILYLKSQLFLGYRKHTLLTIHNMFDAYSLKNKALSVICALLVKKVACCSISSYDRYPSFVKKIKKSNIMPVQNGVDTDRIDEMIANVEKTYNEPKVFAYTARFIPVKNHEFLVKLLPKLNNCKFLFIGSGRGNEQEELEKMAADLGVREKIEFTGGIPRNEVFERLKKADVYISSSLVEGLPISLLEAMYAGLPCILSNINPHVEACKDNAGAEILPLDENVWIEKLNAVAQMSDDELQYKGMLSRKCAKDYFSLEAMHKNYNKIYDTLI